jgi:hypothetical protein
VALRPRLSPGVPLSRDGRTELQRGTEAVNHTFRVASSETAPTDLRPDCSLVVSPDGAGSFRNSSREALNMQHLPGRVEPDVPGERLHMFRVALEHRHPAGRGSSAKTFKATVVLGPSAPAPPPCALLHPETGAARVNPHVRSTRDRWSWHCD